MHPEFIGKIFASGIFAGFTFGGGDGGRHSDTALTLPR